MLDLETVMSVQWTDQQMQVLGTAVDCVWTVA